MATETGDPTESHWHERLTGSVAVLTVAVASVLSVVTGLANIGTTAVLGPLAAILPAGAAEAAAFTGTLTGLVLLVSAFGLRHRLRAAWRSSIVLLPFTALQGVVQSSPLSLPLVAFSVVSIPIVLVNRRRFDRELDLTPSQWAAIVAVVTAQSYGTIGTWALREDFREVNTVLDAFYYTVVTSSTVGYGDLTPESQVAKLFAMSMLVVGVASFGIALGAILGPAIESRLSTALGKMTESQLRLLEDHVMVLGYGDLTEPILNELQERVTTVVITPDEPTAAALADRGFSVLTADPSDEEPLQRAGIEEARAVVVATNNDAQDALAILTANSLNPDVVTVAAATDRENIEKLKRAGADTVISPATIGGHLLVEAALGATDAETVADDLVEHGHVDDEGHDAPE